MIEVELILIMLVTLGLFGFAGFTAWLLNRIESNFGKQSTQKASITDATVEELILKLLIDKRKLETLLEMRNSEHENQL